MSSLPHLHAHHGDFAAFRDVMIDTARTRFGPMWWGIWEQLVRPPAGATLVDLGCGPGVLLEMLRRRDPHAVVIGVDMQPAMLQHAREIAARCGATILEADLAAPIPLPDGTTDVVTAVHLVHEIEYPIPLVAEMWRLVKPGGALVVYDWVKYPLVDYLEGQEPTPDRISHFREHCSYAVGDLEFLLTRQGFVVREILTRKDGHYAVLVVEKPG